MTYFKETQVDLVVTGQDIQRWLHRATAVLRDHVEHLNHINVFPVADGDTGFNMLSTLEAAVSAMEDNPADHLGTTLDAAATGAVKGARGNSGTILSQILVGLSNAAREQSAWTLKEYCQAWTTAYGVAYASVSDPVEGTILTVARAIARHAAGDTFEAVIEHMTDAARQALTETPGLLPALQSRGVVDAGAEGLFLIVAASSDRGAKAAEEHVATLRHVPLHVAPTEIMYPYDVEALIAPWCDGPPLEVLRKQLAEWGDSVVTSEMGTSLKVHVHTKEPPALTKFLFELGPVVQIEILDMRFQEREATGERRWVHMDPAWLPLLPLTVEPWESTREPRAGENVLWIGENPPPGVASVSSPWLACQLMMDYDDTESWEANLVALARSARDATTITVARDEHRYRVRDLSMVNRDKALAAVKALIGMRRMVTIYLSRGAWGGEAEWWQSQLDAEVVDAPKMVMPNHLEIVAQ